jgi:uncharacterized protein YecT (DUF1311 family)
MTLYGEIAWCDLKDAGLLEAETERQEARLNRIYKDIMPQLQNAGKQRLRDRQQAWIKFRDTNVDFYRDPNGETAAMVAGADRYLVMLAHRA